MLIGYLSSPNSVDFIVTLVLIFPTIKGRKEQSIVTSLSAGIVITSGDIVKY